VSCMRAVYSLVQVNAIYNSKAEWRRSTCKVPIKPHCHVN
jgi:hypothetical protein